MIEQCSSLYDLVQTKFPELYLVKHFSSLDSRVSFVRPWINGELSNEFGGLYEIYCLNSKKGVQEEEGWTTKQKNSLKKSMSPA